jgi:ketosteroid isomerase-like protein
MNEQHPHLHAIEAFFAAYAEKDVQRVAEVMAPDVTWFIPGHHPLAGPKRGIPEVMSFFDQLAKANFKAEPKAVALSGDYVIDYHRGWSDVDPDSTSPSVSSSGSKAAGSRKSSTSRQISTRQTCSSGRSMT